MTTTDTSILTTVPSKETFTWKDLGMTSAADPLREVAYYVSRLSSVGGVAIFIFHGVVPDEIRHEVRNYNLKHISRSYFSDLINSLKDAGGVPLSMEDVIKHHEDGASYPPKAFAVTFDDGFENNASVAAEILSKANVPATLYVTSRWVDNNEMGWADRLDNCLEKVRSGSFSIEGIGTFTFATPAGKKEVLRDLRRAFKSDVNLFGQVINITDELYRKLGVPLEDSGDRWLDRKLSWDQVKQLGNNGFIIGGHSVAHETLSQLVDPRLDEIIDLSLESIRTKAGITTRHYAYPEGHAASFDNRVIAALGRYGVVCCPTAIDGLNDQSTDLFRLKRIAVMN